MTVTYLVSHTHWDREWYRTFEAFRARLVDAVDRLLDLLAEDAGYCFVLDGQTIVLEDYLELRPERRAELVAAVRAGRLAIGPWYVQPDSLLPSGESHVRNLLAGAAFAGHFGPLSRVAYTPDSFGHPAQFPQLFAGFGLELFVYWRGNPEKRPQQWRWSAPDGTVLPAMHLPAGYFAASGLDGDDGAAERIAALAERLESEGHRPVVLMNGFDHTLPDRRAGEVAGWLERRGRKVRRALLDALIDEIDPAAPRFEGELLGAADPGANLLPGVWSSRLALKLRNRRCEAQLLGWAEPWCAIGAALGLPDERPALKRAWQALLQNQAHDSIGGCSHDAVHEQMAARYDTAEELATETTRRVLERIAGLDPTRRTPRGPELDIAVFNPCPWPVTARVRVPLDGYPLFVARGEIPDIHPLAMGAGGPAGITVDGQPARLVPSRDSRRVTFLGSGAPLDAEIVVHDVPALGYRRLHLEPTDPTPEEIDGEPHIASEGVEVQAAPDGTLRVRLGDREWSGLAGIEDVTDRGDSYDFDPDPGENGGPLLPSTVSITRRRHTNGIAELEIVRTLPGRDVVVTTVATVAPGVPRVDLALTVDNAATDHRLRLLFPTGAGDRPYRAATTFGIAEREPGPAEAQGWQHPAPATFPHQGWISAGGLVVAAPGLPEAEVTSDGTIAVTVLRAVGWLARLELGTRPIPAGPVVPTPGAQCLGRLEARLSLFAGNGGAATARSAREAELGLRAVTAGSSPLAPGGTPLVEVDGDVAVAALKPPQDGPGAVLRLLGVAGSVATARIHAWTGLGWGAARLVRLDESESASGTGETTGQAPASITQEGHSRWTLEVPDHGLRSVLLSPGS